jgi:glycosyltransferase involved in cell wall biosynthesis
MPPPEHPTLLYLSRLHLKKRPDLLVKVARPLRDMGLRFNVVLAGPGEPDYVAEVMSVAQRLGVDDLTRYLGMVPGALKPSVFAASDLFVLPTHMENFGFVYFESLACATPLVTTKGTDTWQELEASGGGTIVDHIPHGDEGPWIDRLAGTIAGLLRARETLKPRGEAARRWVFRQLEPSRLVAMYVDMYERAIRGSRR